MNDILNRSIRGMVPEDILLFSWLDELALAPSGSALAYTVRRPDAERNGYQIDAYLYRVASGATVKLTSGSGRASALAWSRDGLQLAFVWVVPERTSIEIEWSDRATKQSFTISGEAPAQLNWSPDCHRLVFTRWTEVNRDKRVLRCGVPAPSIRVVHRLRYRQDGVGWVDDRFRQIWVLELATGELVQVTDEECDYSEPVWSWSGDQIAFTGVAREQNIPLGQGQVLINDFATGQTRMLIPGWRGQAVCPQWRADDRAIAFAGYPEGTPTNRRTFSQAWIYDLDNSEARNLSGSIDQTIGNYAVADQRPGLTNVTVKWPGGTGRIYFLLTDQGATHLYSASEAGDPRVEVDGKCVVFEYSPAANGAVAYGHSTSKSPGELFLRQDGDGRQLTHLNRWLSSRQLSPPEEHWYTGVDEAKVHSWTHLPVNFQTGRVYPAIVYVHCSMFSWSFNHEFQCLASAGYVVTYFNTLGTTAGYGQAWTMASVGDQGGRDFHETLLGVDELVKRPYVDSSRLGVTGGSCGGFMTNWIVGHTTRFKAAVTQRSISNEISYFGTSDIGPESGELRNHNHTPWSNLETFWRQSPLSAAASINTPLLILHSDEDFRVPLGQAEELFTALRWQGREVELVIFRGENHSLSTGGRPGNRIERLHRILGWFEKHLRTQTYVSEGLATRR